MQNLYDIMEVWPNCSLKYLDIDPCNRIAEVMKILIPPHSFMVIVKSHEAFYIRFILLPSNCGNLCHLEYLPVHCIFKLLKFRFSL